MISGITVEAGPEAVWVRSAAPLRILSSAVTGGGLGAARVIVNMHVPKGYRCGDPGGDLVAFARRSGIDEPFVGLMTAAWTHEAVTVTDAVVLAWTGHGVMLPYLGPAAPGGWLLARAVRGAVGGGLAREGRSGGSVEPGAVPT